MDKKLERILPRVQKPARYAGGELGQVIKDKNETELRLALCFPDTYEIGMSNLGLRILYGLYNELDGVWCERAFAPWGDMEDELRREGVPLFALDSGDPLSEFDALGFSLGYEMAYTNVLNMLDLAGLAMYSRERSDVFPLVFAGGTACCNPEPLADFMDFFCIGEGEEVGVEVLETLRVAKREGWDKPQILLELSKLGGVYVPSLYEPKYNADGTIAELAAVLGAPEMITRRIVEDFDGSYFPVSPIVPSTEIVHDRVTVELFRGCVRGCRFCQAGFVYRPVRSRDVKNVVDQGVKSLKNTGYQEISLSSLSTSDYRELPALCDGLLDYCEPKSINLSLPSLRADNFSMEIMQRVQRVRKSGLTFAPEAGSQRLRDAINKNVLESDLLDSCRVAFEGGWNGVKLYFMLGLPTETDEDVVAIADLAHKVLRTWKQYAANKSRGVRITVSTSCFVPKPHSPFQWEAQVSRDEYFRRVKLLREAMTAKAITYNWHDPDTSLIEAALSRGDRRIGRVLYEAWRSGGRMDAWSEYFSMQRWLDAFSSCGLEPEFYANREREAAEVLPWSRIDIGVDTDYLRRERDLAYESQLTPDCRKACSACGANVLLGCGVCEEAAYDG